MGARILLVDDEPAIASSLKIVLESKGHAVVTASSTPEAISILHARKFDLIVTDLRMETEGAGFKIVREARRQAYRPLIVILTAYPIARPEWRKAGAHAMISKPIPTEELLRTIERLMASQRSSAGGPH